jgi:hypothetical protein
MNKERNKEIIKVKLNYYRFDISNLEEAQKYKDVCETIPHKKDTTHHSNFKIYGSNTPFLQKIKELDKRDFVDIDTKYLFSNQFNTSEKSLNLRVYLWNEYIYPNKDIKEGYFLSNCEELLKRLDNTFKCSYCGKQYPRKERDKLIFCNSCLDSEYLTIDNLPLLRLRKIKDKGKILPLNDCDFELLKSNFIEAQIKGSSKRGKERIAKLRNDLLTEYQTTKTNAETKYKGMLWLLDKGINTSNVIYYNHTNIFTFGWRKKLSFQEEQEFKEELKDFPYNYKIEVE